MLPRMYVDPRVASHTWGITLMRSSSRVARMGTACNVAPIRSVRSSEPGHGFTVFRGLVVAFAVSARRDERDRS